MAGRWLCWLTSTSAMAGMLNLIPRYLPRYGMSPEWAGAVRPLVLILTGTAFLITWIFDASVDAQGGAYATGVLVLFTSAAVAVTLAARRSGQRTRMYGFAAVALVFELRATEIDFDAPSQVFVRDCARRTIRLVAHQTEHREAEEYVEKIRQLRRDHDLPSDPDVVFVEVTVVDASDFEGRLHVRGEVLHQRYRVMTVTAPSVPNALAALALRIRDDSGAIPHIYFAWTEGNPLQQFLRFLLFGQGEVAPVTREVLRRAEPDPLRRPHVHVG